jgi:GT2 family glycosyltransferase
LWTSILRAGGTDSPRGEAVRCRLPATTTAVELTVEHDGPVQDPPLDRAIWVSPALTDPGALGLPPRLPEAPLSPVVGSSRSPGGGPVISVLMPVHDPPVAMLEEAIASVTAQTVTHWQLCLVDDGSRNPEIIAALQRHAASDPRITLTRHDHARGISEATNTAMAHATGDYIALLDHDDTLTPDALQHVADRITAQPDLDMIYTDEAVLSADELPQHHIKPGWSPEHMAALMYTCHLGVYRRSLAQELGGFQRRFDGCQDYDFVLRLAERTDRIAHIPRVLYHWRAHAASTAGGDHAKPYAYLAQRGAISEHLERSGIEAEVRYGRAPGLHNIVHRVDPAASVDLVLAMANLEGLAEAAASWPLQAHPNWTVTLAIDPDAQDDARAALTRAGIPDTRITTLPTPTTPGAPTTAALAAAAHAGHADYLILMQTPAAGLTHDWLSRLIGYAGQPQIAAAGPVLLAPDGRISQAGIALPDGIPLHLHHGSRAAFAQPVVYNVSAVSGILATRRDTYHHLGGLNPDYHDLALIDYCLRATSAGQRIVIVPDARLHTTAPDTTTNDLPAIWRLRENWALPHPQTHRHDPYYNPNYRTDRGDFILRGPR